MQDNATVNTAFNFLLVTAKIFGERDDPGTVASPVTELNICNSYLLRTLNDKVYMKCHKQANIALNL